MENQALKLAREVAAEYMPVIVDIRLCADMEHGGARCYVIAEKPASANAVYLDEPDTIVMTGNRAGRFVQVSA
jgi:hypothetical protein